MTALTQTTCPLPPHHRFYFLRGSAMIPLIPADVLPFRLQGIPQSLTPQDIASENWKGVREGEEPVTSVLSVQAPTGAEDTALRCSDAYTDPKYLAPDHHVQRESQKRHVSLEAASGGALSPAPSATSPNVTSPPSSPSRPKKVFCTHWIATGECRWLATGCKYKHEMPSIPQLRSLGFTRGIPKWWKEKNAICTVAPRGMTWMERRAASRTHSDDGMEEKALTSSVSRDERLASSEPTTRMPGRCLSEIRDLIDLEEDVPCPQVSERDSVVSSETSVSPSRPFDSPPVSPTRQHIPARHCSRGTKMMEQASKEPSARYASRSSSLSSTSDNESYRAPRTAKSSSNSPRQQQRCKPSSHYDVTRCGIAPHSKLAQPPLGLANSKYAVQMPGSKNRHTPGFEGHGRRALRRERR